MSDTASEIVRDGSVEAEEVEVEEVVLVGRVEEEVEEEVDDEVEEARLENEEESQGEPNPLSKDDDEESQDEPHTPTKDSEDPPGGSHLPAKDNGMQDESPPLSDEEFWYEDGTVIIVARDVEFRVYKGILVEHSIVFADMFSFPQPPSLEPYRCPVVHVDDWPCDLRHIFRFLYPKKSSRFSGFGSRSLTFHATSACVRLGHKYQIDGILKQALTLLMKLYTQDFDRWYGRQFPSQWSPEHTIGVVNLARLVNCRSILPAALLVCCGLETALIDGYKREDGSLETLSPEDFRTCFRVRTKLAQQSAAAVISAFRPFTTHGCRTEKACQGGIVAQLHDYKENVIANVDPFAPWSKYDYLLREDKNVCSRCKQELRNRFVSEQREIWKTLPIIMDVSM